MDTIRKNFQVLYEDKWELAEEGYRRQLEKWKGKIPSAPGRLSERDAILIVYPDSFTRAGEKTLVTLKDFLNHYVQDAVSAVHILPFFPFTSDDGFSIVDYRKVEPSFGDWENVKEISGEYDLMMDAVINHTSKSCSWFQKLLKGEEKYRSFYIRKDPSWDYSSVTRPRTHPLFTQFQSAQGPVDVWTTFSEDQVDLNFGSPEVLEEVLDVLAGYAAAGARYIRLDAVSYVWKQKGTACINLERTHLLVKAIRSFLQEIAPGTMLITETNVPHQENIAYLGNGCDEATMVYQFALPPLVLYAYLSGDTRVLRQWLSSLWFPESHATYFNFLASHDGIGLQPVTGILSEDQRQLLVNACTAAGGRVSYKSNSDGTQSVYELNVNYQDGLTPFACPESVKAQRFLGAQCIMLSVKGVPGIYYHSLLGSHNDVEGMLQSGISRKINRKKLDSRQVEEQLAEGADSAGVFQEYLRLLRLRKEHPAFSPYADQQVLESDPALFCLARHSRETGEHITVVVNVSQEVRRLELTHLCVDLISGQKADGSTEVPPYGYLWLLAENREETI